VCGSAGGAEGPGWRGRELGACCRDGCGGLFRGAVFRFDARDFGLCLRDGLVVGVDARQQLCRRRIAWRTRLVLRVIVLAQLAQQLSRRRFFRFDPAAQLADFHGVARFVAKVLRDAAEFVEKCHDALLLSGCELGVAYGSGWPGRLST
jgi:hypothetical protein